MRKSARILALSKKTINHVSSKLQTNEMIKNTESKQSKREKLQESMRKRKRAVFSILNNFAMRKNNFTQTKNNKY